MGSFLSRRMLMTLVITLTVLLAGGCANVKPVTVAEIRAMSSAGMSADDIVLAMKDSNTVFRLNASQLVELHENDGLPDPVINYMQKSQIDAIHQEYEYCDGYGVYY